MRRALLIAPLLFIVAACRDVPQAPNSKTDSDNLVPDASLSIDSANVATADSALSPGDTRPERVMGAANTPAVISNIAFPAQALVGQPVTLSFSFSDDAADGPWFVGVDWSPDEGVGRQVSSFTDPVTFSFAYATVGHYTVLVRVFDNWGAVASFTRDIDIADASLNTPVGTNVHVQPTATPSGTPATVTFASVTTAGNTTVAVSSITSPLVHNVRFGSTTSLYAIATSAVVGGTTSVCIVYDPAQYPRSGRARLLHQTNMGAWADVTTTFDSTTHTVCGETTLGNFIVGLANAAPTASLAAPAGIEEANTATFTATASDVDGDALTYVWSFGDGSASVTSAQPTASHLFNDNGAFSVSVVARDVDGMESAPATVSYAVANVAPTASLSAPASIQEGSNITLSLANPADPSSVDRAAGFSYSYDCGNGFGVWSPSSSGACATTDNGIRVVRAKIRDKDLGEHAYQATVSVLNAAPTLGTLTGPTGVVRVNEPVTVSAAVTDPGSADTHTATIDWGDGTTENVAVQGGVAAGTHSYRPHGTYTISMYVTDKDGAVSATQQFVLTVGNGQQGHGHGSTAKPAAIIGAGTFLDASTPVAASSSVTERHKVRFTIFARTRPDAGTVGPDASFDLRAGKLAFKALTFDALDVNGELAGLRGTGRIVGDAARYAFLVSAMDADQRRDKRRDFIRVRVWNASTGQVVFDSQPGTPDGAAPATRLMDGNLEVR